MTPRGTRGTTKYTKVKHKDHEVDVGRAYNKR